MPGRGHRLRSGLPVDHPGMGRADFLDRFIREIDQALAADLAPRSSKNTPKSSGGVGTSSGREDSFDPASARQTGDDPNSSRLVLWVAAVIALIAAFTVVLKRRGKH